MQNPGENLTSLRPVQQRIPNDPDPDEAPGVLTLRRVEAIKAKPIEQWTDAERQYMASGVEWAAEFCRGFAEAVRPAMEMFIQGMSEIGRQLSERMPTITVALNDIVDAEIVEDNEWLPTDTAPSDQFRHIDGLPGISERCWADVWIEVPNHPDLSDYAPCNAPAANDLGTCADHQL